MAMLTRTSAEAAGLMERELLIDTIQVYDASAPRTEGINVVRDLTAVGDPIPGLVQTTTLANAVESRTDSTYAVKVSQKYPLNPGQVVEVVTAVAEPALQGKKLLIDKVSLNGMALLRKGVAADWDAVNQEGKEGL